MVQSEMDREIDRIKDLILLLAKRKYILKSELRHILSACRNNELAFSELEDLMFSVIDDTVSYIDDTEVSDSFHICTQLQDELKKLDYTDLFQYLKVSEETTLEEITLVYQRNLIAKDNGELCPLIDRIICDDDTFRLYHDVCLAQAILDQFCLRRDFGLHYLSEVEYNRLIDDMILNCNMDIQTAKNMMETALLKYGLYVTVDRNITQTEKKEPVLDEFLIPIPDLNSNQQSQNIYKNNDRRQDDGRH